MATQRPSDTPFLGEVIASQSLPWVVTGSINVVNTAGQVVSVLNSAGWIVSVSNTGGSITVTNTAANVNVINTAGQTFSVINSAGWLVNVINTGGSVIVTNTATNVSIVNSAGWVSTVSAQLLVGGALAGSMTALLGPNAYAIGSVGILNTILTTSSQLLASVAIAGTHAVIGSISSQLLASVVAVGSVGILNASLVTSSQLLASVAAIGSVGVLNINRALQAGSSLVGTANVLGVVSSQLLGGVAAVGSVSLLNAVVQGNSGSQSWLVGLAQNLSTSSGIVSTNGGITILPAVATSSYFIYSYAFTYVNTLENLIILRAGTAGSGKELWRLDLQSPASVTVGANLVVDPPSYLFRTGTNTALSFVPSQAQTAHYSLGYYLDPDPRVA